MGPNAIIGRRARKIYMPLAMTMLLAAVCSVTGREVRAERQNQLDRQPASSETLVIQGRITAIQGSVVTVKTPDGYPGGAGIHAQFVTAGPTLTTDVSRARILLPDGRQADKVPLAVGDRVLMVLTRPDSGAPTPDSFSKTYFASIVERLAQSDKIITH